MGEINLLRAGYAKKVGNTYGVEGKGSFYLKAVPFSHTPHSQKQNKAVDAFTRLNRFSSKVAKDFWKYLNLSDRKMYKNNAVSQWLKAALVENSFQYENLENIIPATGHLVVNTSEFNQQTAEYSITLENIPDTPNADEEVIFAGIFTDRAVCKASAVRKGSTITLTGIFNLVDFPYIQVVAFKAVPNGKHYKITSLFVGEKIYYVIVNGIFFMSRYEWTQLPYILNGVLYLPTNATVENGVLKII